MTVKPVFARPLEVTTSNNSFIIKLDPDDGGGLDTHVVNIGQGIHGSIFNYGATMETALDALDANWAFTITFEQVGDDLHMRIVAVDSNTTQAPKATFSENYDIIGAAGASEDDETWTESPANTYTMNMTYRPTHMWIPTYQSADQNRFQRDQAEAWEGKMAKSGFLSGNRTGPSLWWRDFEFVNEKAENLFDEAATDARQKARNLETFGLEARAVATQTAGNGCAKGFYYIHDWNDVTSVRGGLSGNGGIDFDLSSGADLYAFCQLGPRGYSRPQASLPTTKTRYTTGFSVHTVDYAVSWDY